jgi:membrane protein YfhO
MIVSGAHDERKRLVRATAQARVRLTGVNPHLGAALLLGLLLLVYLWPALIEGRVLTADASLYNLAPWKAFTPSNVDQFDNTILIDVPRAHYTWDLFDRQSILHGVLPVWNNEILAGFPYYANSQSGLTSLLNIPLWLLPFNFALGLVAWLKLLIASFGSYLLARRLRLGFWPGMLAGVAYSLCAFNVVWLAHQTLVASAVWVPWLVLLIESLLHRVRRRDVVLLALVSALVLDGGHPGTEVQVMGAGAVYALVRSLTLISPSGRDRLRRLIVIALSTVLGALLMSFLLIPVLKSSSGTIGVAYREGGGFIMPWSALRTALFPDWWGRPSEMNYGGPVNYVERTLYVGTITLLLAGFALTMRDGWRRKAPFLVIAVLGIAVPFDVPVIHSLFVALPLFSSVQDARMIFWLQFAVAMLSAFGLQMLIESSPRLHRRAWAVLGTGLLASVLALLLLDPSLHEIRTTLNHFRTGTEYHLEGILALTSVGWWTIFTCGALLLVLIGRRRLPRGALAAGLVLLAALDMLHFAHGFQPQGPPSQVIPPTPPVARFLEPRATQGRTMGINDALTNDYTMNYGLSDVRGYDPPQPTDRYFHLWQLANPLQGPSEDLQVTQLNATGLRVMSLLGARFLVADPAEARLSLPGLSTIYTGMDAVVYENSRAVPAAFAPASVVKVPTEEAMLVRIASSGYDPRREALVEGPAGGLRAARGGISVQRDKNADVRMTVRLTRGGLIVLNDDWAPGWSVSVDGHPAPVVRVNDVMRGVDVPTGDHLVAWHYTVPGLREGAILAGLALVLLLLIGAWPTGWLPRWVSVGRRPQRTGRARGRGVARQAPPPR